jgi:hypothetical protein
MCSFYSALVQWCIGFIINSVLSKELGELEVSAEEHRFKTNKHFGKPFLSHLKNNEWGYRMRFIPGLVGIGWHMFKFQICPARLVQASPDC